MNNIFDDYPNVRFPYKMENARLQRERRKALAEHTLAWELVPDDSDDVPLVRMAIMGGQGRTGADVRSYSMAIVVPFVIGLVCAVVAWIL